MHIRRRREGKAIDDKSYTLRKKFKAHKHLVKMRMEIVLGS
jgi:hypothetical protein